MGSIVAELAEKLTSATNSFDIDEQTLYVNTSADTVGIGTNSPDGKLSVHQSGTDDIFNLYDGTTNILSVADGGTLTHKGTLLVGVDDTGHDVKFFGATATNGYMLWDESADSLVLGSSSKLGIGITAPTEKLEVGGNIKIADGGTIGSATTGGAITIAANGALTLSTAPAGFNYVATVAAAQTGSTDGIVITGSGTAAAGVTVAHADTSSQANVNNSGNSFIQDITLDTYGHITGITSATATDNNTTYSAGNGISLSSTTFSVAAGGGLTQEASGLAHSDTSSQATVNNSGSTFIQDITLDTYGHITGISSASAGVPAGTLSYQTRFSWNYGIGASAPEIAFPANSTGGFRYYNLTDSVDLYSSGTSGDVVHLHFHMVFDIENNGGESPNCKFYIYGGSAAVTHSTTAQTSLNNVKGGGSAGVFNSNTGTVFKMQAARSSSDNEFNTSMSGTYRTTLSSSTRYFYIVGAMASGNQVFVYPDDTNLTVYKEST